MFYNMLIHFICKLVVWLYIHQNNEIIGKWHISLLLLRKKLVWFLEWYWIAHRLSVAVLQITPNSATENKYLLFHNFWGSGIWEWLGWVSMVQDLAWVCNQPHQPCLQSSQALTEEVLFLWLWQALEDPFSSLIFWGWLLYASLQSSFIIGKLLRPEQMIEERTSDIEATIFCNLIVRWKSITYATFCSWGVNHCI